jgi:molybdopterin molybdotransferase
LAEDIISSINVPAGDNSAMDGYAFDGAVLSTGRDSGSRVSLRIAGTALAGAQGDFPCDPGEALRIMTGALMPVGVDTVIPQELCQVRDGCVSFSSLAVRRGDNRRRAGEDVWRGQAVLQRGAKLSPAALGIIASLGIAQVQVNRRLRVAYLSTGDELLAPGMAMRPGAVYDSNRYTLFGLIERLGCIVVDMGSVQDDPSSLEDTIRDACRCADVIVTTGGVSDGDADHLGRVLESMGEVASWQVDMRPGRPFKVGIVRSAESQERLLFGLPGNPVAAMVSFLVFLRPFFLGMMGRDYETEAPVLLRGRSVGAIRKKLGRTEYQRVRVNTVGGALPEVRLTGAQGSGILRSMVEANGLVILAPEQADIAAGDEVDVMMFEGVMN